jgi:hypothetical protein
MVQFNFEAPCFERLTREIELNEEYDVQTDERDDTESNHDKSDITGFKSQVVLVHKQS